MKVVCIDDYTLSGKKIKGLTVGKTYDVVDFIYSSPWVSQIVDDNGYKVWYNDEVLMPLEKWRELQLKELGI
jgi:hypothetical protein